MTAAEYISGRDGSRKEILANLHEIITNTDQTVVAEVGKLMGKEMILYKASKVFKYGLSSLKDHMSLHVFPMYMSPAIYGKYIKLLDQAKFQKGCINFKTMAEMPLPIVTELITDCSTIDPATIIEKSKMNRS